MGWVNEYIYNCKIWFKLFLKIGSVSNSLCVFDFPSCCKKVSVLRIPIVLWDKLFPFGMQDGFQFDSVLKWQQTKHKLRIPRGVMANVLNCSIIVSEFEIHSC